MTPLSLLIASLIAGSTASYCLPGEGARLNGHWCWFSTSVYCYNGVDQSVTSCSNGCLNGFCVRTWNCSATAPLFLSLVSGACRSVAAMNQSGFSISMPFDYATAEYDVTTFLRKYAHYTAVRAECRGNLTALLCERAYTNCALGTQSCINAAARASAACPGLGEEMNYNSLCSMRPAEITTVPFPVDVIIVLSIAGILGLLALGPAIMPWIYSKCVSDPRCCWHTRCLKWDGRIGCKKC